MDYVLPGDFWLILKMQDMGDWITPIMKFFTSLGNPGIYLCIIAIIYWSIDRKLGLRLAIFLPVVISLNSILKQAFHAPRPYWVNPDIEAIKVSNGFGLPSGHAQASTVWLYAAACLRSSCFWFIAIVFTCMVGLSRVYLGVHFFSQVLFGWLIGIGVLILFSLYERKVLTWFLSKKFVIQLSWLGGITALILIVGWFFVHLLEDWTMPLEWIKNAADDLACKNESICSSVGIGDVAGSAGGFLGLALGALLSHRKGGFDAGGTVCNRICRSLIGILISSALFAIIWYIKPEKTLELQYAIWYFCGLFVISIFIFFLLPLLFSRMKLFPSNSTVE